MVNSGLEPIARTADYRRHRARDIVALIRPEIGVGHAGRTSSRMAKRLQLRLCLASA